MTESHDRNPSSESPRAVKLTKHQLSMLRVAEKIGYMWPGSEGSATARSLVARGLLSKNLDRQYRLTPAGRQALQEGPEHE